MRIIAFCFQNTQSMDYSFQTRTIRFVHLSFRLLVLKVKNKRLKSKNTLAIIFV